MSMNPLKQELKDIISTAQDCQRIGNSHGLSWDERFDLIFRYSDQLNWLISEMPWGIRMPSARLFDSVETTVRKITRQAASIENKAKRMLSAL